uniref:RNase H type-1 domain-containing protein n=1 Tax=viral metagenome TaxID=1070528 RepID=A0A6C0HGR6_9ZZZZ
MNQKKLTQFFQKSSKIAPQVSPLIKVENTTIVYPEPNSCELRSPEFSRYPTASRPDIFAISAIDKPTNILDPQTPDTTYCMMFDGCSKGNPGAAGAGAVIYANNVEIWSRAIYVGNRETNNLAEYTGMLLGLNEAVRRNIRVLIVKGDSEVVIKQMLGKYKVKSENLLDIYEQAKDLEKHFDKIDYIHVYRHFNTRADALSNEGLAKITGRK